MSEIYKKFNGKNSDFASVCFIILIWNGKFFLIRMLPFGPKLFNENK